MPNGQHPLIGSCLNLSYLLFESQSLTFSMTSGVESAIEIFEFLSCAHMLVIIFYYEGDFATLYLYHLYM